MNKSKISQVAVNKIAGFIVKMYLKDKRAGNISYRLPKKKKKVNNALFDCTG